MNTRLLRIWTLATSLSLAGAGCQTLQQSPDRFAFEQDRIEIPVEGFTKDGWLTSGIIALVPSEPDMARHGVNTFEVEEMIRKSVQQACRDAFRELKASHVQMTDNGDVLMRAVYKHVGWALKKTCPDIDFDSPPYDRYKQSPPRSPEDLRRLEAAEAREDSELIPLAAIR